MASTSSLAFHLLVILHVIITFVTDVTDGLHIERLVVPVAAKKGDEQQLSCHYHLDEDETLYALRWYKDDKEFFRYMPKETPTLRVFNVSGVTVDTGMSTSNSVMLVSVEVSASGLYRCEVSMEAPSFETDVKEAHFKVVEPPMGNPFITLAKGTLGPTFNEPIIANCSGPAGQPVPQLMWTLATHPIPSDSKHIRQSFSYGTMGGHNEASTIKEERMTSMLHLPADWLKKFMALLHANRAPVQQTHSGPYINLPLRCTSHTLGLYELSDTVDIRIRVKEPLPPISTAHSQSNSRSIAYGSSPTGGNTLHGAFTVNSAAPSSSFIVSLFGWTSLISFSLMIHSSWTITRWYFYKV